MARWYLLFSFLLGGCDIDTGSAAGGINTGPLPEGCTKIEGGEIGKPQTMVAGDVTVQITDWITKDGEPNEYIGFNYTTDGPADITIKSGQTEFVEDGDGTWSDPAHGISNVVVCEGMAEEPICDENDPCGGTPTEPPASDPNDPAAPSEPAPSEPPADNGMCTADEQCATGICLEGVCVSI